MANSKEYVTEEFQEWTQTPHFRTLIAMVEEMAMESMHTALNSEVGERDKHIDRAAGIFMVKDTLISFGGNLE